MRVSERCAACLYDKQKNITKDTDFLEEIRSIIKNRGENDSAPYLVYLFQQCYERHFGNQSPYVKIKKKYNDIVLSMENSIRSRIESSSDPLAKALAYARVGNYIDFGAMDQVDEDTFLDMLERVDWKDEENEVYQSFVAQCEKAKNFLILIDNCGEIVLDRLFLEQLKKCFPDLHIVAMVRGGEVLNDATIEDATYVGLDLVADVVTSGLPIAGTVYDLLSDEAREAMDEADVILSKGQGNYEALSKQGLHVFYSFLCKCDVFIERFNVPKLTGLFLEE